MRIRLRCDHRWLSYLPCLEASRPELQCLQWVESRHSRPPLTDPTFSYFVFLWFTLVDEPSTAAAPPPRRRHDGWTPERQALFLATLETTGCVTAAATAARKSRAGAYRFRDRSDGARFGRLWEQALRSRSERLLRRRLAKLTVAASARRGQSVAGRSFSLPKAGQSEVPGETLQQRKVRQDCRLSTEREAELWAIVAAGFNAPSQGRG
jgi:hypothetical protein